MLYTFDSPELRKFEKKMHDEAVKTNSPIALSAYRYAHALRHSCCGKWGGKR